MIDSNVEIEQSVSLPKTTEHLDCFVADIIQEFDLPPGDDTYDTIATMILHLPQTTAFKEKSYFGHAVWKSLANKAAYDKLTEFRKKREAEAAAKLEHAPPEEILEAHPASGQPI